MNLGIFAPPEHGKTEVLLQFSSCKGVKIISDVTSFGISKFILPEIAMRRIKCIIFPDFSRIFCRSSKVADGVLSLLNVLIEEGISSVYTYNVQFDVGLMDNSERIKCGCILACSEDLIRRRVERLSKYGFWSRILPFYIEYTSEDLLRAHEDVKEEKRVFRQIKLKLPDNNIEVKLPREEADKLDPIVFAYRNTIGSKTGLRLR